eukprot:g54576.t1
MTLDEIMPKLNHHDFYSTGICRFCGKTGSQATQDNCFTRTVPVPVVFVKQFHGCDHGEEAPEESAEENVNP